MATIAQTIPNLNSRASWLWEFLKEELAPYPGRTALVTRTVVASTLVMILSMTFKMPFSAYGPLWAFIFGCASIEATPRNIQGMMAGLAFGGAYIILGLAVVLADPVLRFVWVAGGFFLSFWGMSAFSRYRAPERAGYLMAITVTLWDAHISAEQKLEDTLWAIGVIAMAGIILLGVDTVFAAFRRSNELVAAIGERLSCVEESLTQYRDGVPVDGRIRTELARLAMTGTSRMRQMLYRPSGQPGSLEEMGAVVALTGRLVDLTASLPELGVTVPEVERERMGKLAGRIRQIREDLTKGSLPQEREPAAADETPPHLPLLVEMEQTVCLLYQAFAGSGSLSVFTAPGNATETPKRIVVSELLAARHFQFALRGAMAATASYIVINAFNWPQTATAVTTCFVTAMTTIGASRQKQILRISGALIGCFVIGMGAQIFLLPYIDSIAGFTALFIPVTAVAAWIATSSPRLGYLGIQVGVAFYMINLQEFRFNTSLYEARDRACGILIGLLAMWLFFDQLWSTPAGVLMRNKFISTLRLLAELARQPVSSDIRTGVERSYALRETINSNFDQVRAQADAVIFEFGPSRGRDMEFREGVRRWQPQLRTLFLLRIAALKYELQTPGFEVPETVRLRQHDYDELSARMLEQLADRIANREPGMTQRTGDLGVSIMEALRTVETEASRELPSAKAHSLITLLRAINDLTTRLAQEMAAELTGL